MFEAGTSGFGIVCDAVTVSVVEVGQQAAARRVVAVRGPAEQRGEREGGGHDQEGEYHVHGSNCSLVYIPPTVAELTMCVKILP